INEAASGSIAEFGAAGVQVLHVSGSTNVVDVERPSGSPVYRVVPYVDRMDLAYAASDLVLCRAGAMTCAELAAVGLPAVYVPLPHGNGEQRLNAMPVVNAGGGVMVADDELTPDWVAQHVVPLAADGATLNAMSKAAAKFGRRDADEAIVKMV